MSQVNVEEQTTGPVTQVTSLAKEEQRTGIKANVPSAEELVARASSSIIVNTKRLNDLIEGKGPSQKYKISRGGMNRVLLAILNLPTEGLPVNLKSDEEKLAFALGQRLISDRFVLTQYHVSQEYQKQKEARAAAEAQTNQGESNVTEQPTSQA